MGRCSGNRLFGCKVLTDQQNYVCKKCEGLKIPLSRCRFSEHYMFEGEDGHYISKKPKKIQVKKFSFVYGWWHLVVFRDSKAAAIGSKVVNEKRPFRYGLRRPEELLPPGLWQEGIPLVLKKQLHRLTPIAIPYDSPNYVKTPFDDLEDQMSSPQQIDEEEEEEEEEEYEGIDENSENNASNHHHNLTNNNSNACCDGNGNGSGGSSKSRRIGHKRHGSFSPTVKLEEHCGQKEDDNNNNNNNMMPRLIPFVPQRIKLEMGGNRRSLETARKQQMRLHLSNVNYPSSDSGSGSGGDLVGNCPNFYSDFPNLLDLPTTTTTTTRTRTTTHRLQQQQHTFGYSPQPTVKLEPFSSAASAMSLGGGCYSSALFDDGIQHVNNREQKSEGSVQQQQEGQSSAEPLLKRRKCGLKKIQTQPLRPQHDFTSQTFVMTPQARSDPFFNSREMNCS